MKTTLKLITALLYFSFMSVVSTYYLFDDKASDPGYMSPMNGVPYANYGSVHKKRYSGNSNSKFIRGDTGRNSDYQFNLVKTPQHSNYGAAQVWSGNDRNGLVTDTPTILERPKHEANVVKPPQRESREESSSGMEMLPNPNMNRAQGNPMSNSAHNDHYKAQMKEKSLQPSYEMYKTLEVNVNKKPIVTDPQKNSRNRLASTLSINSFPNYYRRLQTAANMGMHGHKSEKYSDPNAPLLHKMLENMSNKLPARKAKTYDFRKRDTSGNVVQMYVVPHEISKDEGSKSSKEMAKDHMKRADVNANFAGAEIKVVTNDKPYAVFYRMNPVALAGPQEIEMNTMNVDPNGKKESLNMPVNVPVNVNTENDAPLSGTLRDAMHHGSVKIHKTIKNFSSYKKY